jgi:hypothetical protein
VSVLFQSCIIASPDRYSLHFFYCGTAVSSQKIRKPLSQLTTAFARHGPKTDDIHPAAEQRPVDLHTHTSVIGVDSASSCWLLRI